MSKELHFIDIYMARSANTLSVCHLFFPNPLFPVPFFVAYQAIQDATSCHLNPGYLKHLYWVFILSRSKLRKRTIGGGKNDAFEVENYWTIYKAAKARHIVAEPFVVWLISHKDLCFCLVSCWKQTVKCSH